MAEILREHSDSLALKLSQPSINSTTTIQAFFDLKKSIHTMRQESIVKAMRSRRARDRRALTGEAGNASRRKVICGRHGHELRRSECVPDAGRIAA
ncbi:hypothetical protein [Rickettsiella endosymbiont of Dermanyssus gallinae]|uniref:hypothetical protein n=1 Tax=Rickettsiella endosymbiont of Dermanyssus gallinae TaxID=2856608 RepID=UPI001C52AE41|nr:hypothetical protein [Rickettsiella endosymbiont of Dermanyssus gallinae]